jgi:hypothetical protein
MLAIIRPDHRKKAAARSDQRNGRGLVIREKRVRAS